MSALVNVYITDWKITTLNGNTYTNIYGHGFNSKLLVYWKVHINSGSFESDLKNWVVDSDAMTHPYRLQAAQMWGYPLVICYIR